MLHAFQNRQCHILALIHKVTTPVSSMRKLNCADAGTCQESCIVTYD